MKQNKIVDLEEYKLQKQLNRQMEELDRIGEEQYHHMNPTEQQGFRNFMRLLKGIDEKYGKKD